jgi:hypothetical protein
MVRLHRAILSCGFGIANGRMLSQNQRRSTVFRKNVQFFEFLAQLRFGPRIFVFIAEQDVIAS